MIQWSYIVNMMLFIVNLLPLYPTDGWKVLRYYSPDSWKDFITRYEKLGMIVLIALMVTPFGQLCLEFLFQKWSKIVMDLYSW